MSSNPLTGRPLTVRKRYANGRLRIAYPARWRQRTDELAEIDAHWQHAPLDLGYTRFEPGDHFIERYYPGRWYTIFEIHRGDDEALKGWYCDIVRPPRITDEGIDMVDLALDVWVGADGTVLVMDEEEFAQLRLDEHDPAAYAAARAGLAELLGRIREHRPPFDILDGTKA
ncbi:MAG TPA: DUF402 domain-containing protein [Anaerolineae bacterium]|nr:DUF402 domain-containing protein [Anaerolineae bacterium]